MNVEYTTIDIHDHVEFWCDVKQILCIWISHDSSSRSHKNIALICCVLHNFIKVRRGQLREIMIIDEEWDKEQEGKIITGCTIK